MSFFEFPHTRTYDTDLGWLIKKVNSFDETIEVLDNWISENQPKIDDFEKLYQMLITGDLPEGVQKGIEIWMRENAADILDDIVSLVFFGLEIIDGAGYFCAYIPESWEEIIFGTSGLDDFPPDTDFGHLTLSLNIGG